MRNLTGSLLMVLAATFVMPLHIFGQEIDPPNVLIALDNSANWGPDSEFQGQKAAILEAINQLPEGSINLGLMMYTETNEGDSNIDGGYVRAAIRNMLAALRLVRARATTDRISA